MLRLCALDSAKFVSAKFLVHFLDSVPGKSSIGLPCFELRSQHTQLQPSKKQNVSSPLTREDSILWGASVTERSRARHQTTRARISNPVSGGQCHLLHLTILRRFSWPSLAYILPHFATQWEIQNNYAPV